MRERHITETGTAYWAKVHAPQANAKFPNADHPEGEYSIQLRFGDAESEGLRKLITDQMFAHHRVVGQERMKKHLEKHPKQKAKFDTLDKFLDAHPVEQNDLPFYQVLDDMGDPTGEWEFKFRDYGCYYKKDKASGQVLQTIENKITVRDAQNKPMTVEVGNGSQVKVAFEIFPYVSANIGIKLILKGVQVVDLVPYGGSASVDFEVCEGYTQEVVADAEEMFEEEGVGF